VQFPVGTRVVFGVTKTKGKRGGAQEVLQWSGEAKVASLQVPLRFMSAAAKTGVLTQNYLLLNKIKAAAAANRPAKPAKFLKGILVNPCDGKCINSSPVEFKTVASFMDDELIDSLYVEVSCVMSMSKVTAAGKQGRLVAASVRPAAGSSTSSSSSSGTSKSAVRVSKSESDRESEHESD